MVRLVVENRTTLQGINLYLNEHRSTNRTSIELIFYVYNLVD